MTLLQSAYIHVINLSIAASFLMLAVILLRQLLKKVPKWLICVMWALVAVRLVVPFSLESRWSLIPAWKVVISQGEEMQTAYNEISLDGKEGEVRQDESIINSSAEEHDAEHAEDESIEKVWEIYPERNAWPVISQESIGENAVNTDETVIEAVKPLQYDWDMGSYEIRESGSESISGDEVTILTDQQTDEQSEILPIVGSIVWLVGILVMLIYFATSFVRLRRKVGTAVRLETDAKEDIWECDAIAEPFILGIVRPRIYLPSNLGEENLECVLCHEQAHIRRGDYLWKPLGFLILCVYWFHPLCWISYLLFCRDVELACDEKATKGFSKEERKRYCQTLLDLECGNRSFLTGTVAFGENGTKSRVKAILNYKKPTFWVILAGVLACLAMVVFFMTSPSGNSIGSWLKSSTKLQRTDVVYDEEGNAREIFFDIKLRNSSNGILLSGSVLYDGNTYYDAKAVFKDKWEGDGGNLFFIPKDYALDVWEDYVRIDPLDDKMDAYLLSITTAGETKSYSSEKPEGKESNVTDVPVGTDKTLDPRQEGDKKERISVSESEYGEIYEFMQEFMTFPVIWDFDQQNMSGAVDYFGQKWVWTDVTDLEYDAEAKAFYVSANDFVEKMGQYFVLSDSARKAIEEKSRQGKFEICADNYLPWFWGFSFGIDRVEVKEGIYYVHGYNAEITENRARNSDIMLIGGNTDPFLEFNAVMVRDEEDGRFRLKELDGLKYGPGRKVNVTQISDAERMELVEFAELFTEGSVLEQYDLNDLTGVFDFAAQKILQTHPEAVREGDDGCCVVSLSELMSFMEQHFYLPNGFEKCLPREGDGTDAYPCLGKDGVMFLKKEVAEGFNLRSDLPVIQNERYYSFGVFNVDSESLRSKLAAEGKDLTAINTAVEEQYPYELAVFAAVRGKDGRLRLLFFESYDL